MLKLLLLIICICAVKKVIAALPGNLISFRPFDKEVSIGMHVDAPFLSIATKRQPFENNQALINFNPAALITSGVVIAASFLLSASLKTLLNTPKEESRESRDVASNLLDNFSMTVTNTTGFHSDTTLNGLLEIVEQRIYNNQEVNLPVCFQKAICSLIIKRKKGIYYENNESEINQIVDGLMSIDWFQNMLQSVPFINDILNKDQLTLADDYCDSDFQACKLNNPISHFWYFLNNTFYFS